MKQTVFEGTRSQFYAVVTPGTSELICIYQWDSTLAENIPGTLPPSGRFVLWKGNANPLSVCLVLTFTEMTQAQGLHCSLAVLGKTGKGGTQQGAAAAQILRLFLCCFWKRLEARVHHGGTHVCSMRRLCAGKMLNGEFNLSVVAIALVTPSPKIL